MTPRPANPGGDQAPRAPSGPYRCGYVALAGRPNVGKSSLLNALVGAHLSIVSAKAQTTRERVAGLLTTDRYQILFLDAPGLIQPGYALQRAMSRSAEEALYEADVVTLLVDATRLHTFPTAELCEALQQPGVPIIVAINKVDLVDDTTADGLVRRALSLGLESLAISATTGLGLAELEDRLVSHLPESAPLFPVEDVATQSVRFFAEEYVRESCMDRLRDELPYSIVCRVEEFNEQQDPLYVRICIFVERSSQKGIVIGRGGSMIKQIGQSSREKIEQLIGRKVFLDLRVKVLPGWSRKQSRLRQLGFRVPPEPRGGQ